MMATGVERPRLRYIDEPLLFSPSDTMMQIQAISNTSSDEELLAVARHVGQSGEIGDICALAEVLARSGGEPPVWPREAVADIPSTGGPFSLSTLLCPLALSAMGLYVPKLGVPGRPAGGIDCMLQIPGYRAEFDTAELQQIVKTANFAHFLAGNRFAPLDARMFALRQRNDLQANVNLAAASILSKKIAVGVRQVGLDIRVAHWGNFGGDTESAKISGNLFITAAERLGIRAFAFLTDATVPYQPYLGRAESLVAVSKVICEGAEGALSRHAAECLRFASTVGGGTISWCEARPALASHLEAQGTSIQAFDETVARTEAEHGRVIIRATKQGRFHPDIPALRDVLVSAQAGSAGKCRSAFPDPLGVLLLATAGETVELDQPLASVRSTGGVWEQFGIPLRDALCVHGGA